MSDQNDTETVAVEQECPRCEESGRELKDMSDDDRTHYDELCPECLVAHSKKVSRAKERQKQRESDLAAPGEVNYERFW